MAAVAAKGKSDSAWSGALIAMFLAFAFAYFLSALLRAVTATLAPTFSRELGLSAGDLGLLAGAYFLGFSFTQLPLGKALDRWGPRRVMVVFLLLAAVACLAFSRAVSLTELVVSRMAIGMGVSACLMAPLTAYRTAMLPSQQLRANAWMLMTGSLGMLASTLPVQWLMPLVGWRGLFVAIAAAIALAILLVAWCVPKQARAVANPARPTGDLHTQPSAISRHAIPQQGYHQIFRHPRFLQLLPVGLFCYGGMVAVQSLWAGPWMTKVAGYSAESAAAGLFFINLSMLMAFFAWGVVSPKLAARGVNTYSLMRWGMPLALIVLPILLVMGSSAGAAMWALWCVSSTIITLSQPQIAQEFEASLAGRALSAYNLVLFVGIFVVQWGIGMLIDGFVVAGWSQLQAFRGAFAIFAVLCMLSYAWYCWRDAVIRVGAGVQGPDNAPS